MLENAIRACPESLWGDRAREPEYWYVAYHTLFWLDFDLWDSDEAFAPPPPYDLGELDPAGVLPPRVYSQQELLGYLEHGRAKCRASIDGLTDERAISPSGSMRPELSVLEQHLYSLRHVQHHAAQLNLLLRQGTDSAPRWVGRAATGLDPD